MHCPKCHVNNLRPDFDDICYWCGTVLDKTSFHYTPSLKRKVIVHHREEESVTQCAGAYVDYGGVIQKTDDCKVCKFSENCKQSPDYMHF